MLAVKAARPACQLAAIANSRGRGVTRQFGELERSGKALLDGFSLIASDRFEPRASAVAARRRVYTSVRNMPRINNGLGVTIVSTPKGVMADHDARDANVGGEILCTVF